MPNWIEGTLKIRGNDEDLKRFFKEGLEASTTAGYKKSDEEAVKCDLEGSWREVWLHDEPHIKGTRRAFVENNYICWEKAYDCVAMNIKQAWAFNTDEFQKISKQFNLDIRFWGVEKGMEFCQDVEISRGTITRNDELKYDDFIWDCPMPLLGG